MEKRRFWFIISIILLAIIVFFIFGYIGQGIVDKTGAKCDLGLLNVFCWKWTKVIFVDIP